MTEIPHFCARCGKPLRQAVPPGDNRPRAVCPACDYVAYVNPRILVACITTWEDKVLWIRRAIEPRCGFWAMPAGFMENGETPEQAAVRELEEETRAVLRPEALTLYTVASIPEISEVYIVYRGELEAPVFEATEETLDVALRSVDEAPWDQFAYPEVVETLRRFYVEHQQRRYNVYSGCYVDGVYTLLPVKG